MLSIPIYLMMGFMTFNGVAHPDRPFIIEAATSMSECQSQLAETKHALVTINQQPNVTLKFVCQKGTNSTVKVIRSKSHA